MWLKCGEMWSIVVNCGWNVVNYSLVSRNLSLNPRIVAKMWSKCRRLNWTVIVTLFALHIGPLNFRIKVCTNSILKCCFLLILKSVCTIFRDTERIKGRMLKVIIKQQTQLNIQFWELNPKSKRIENWQCRLKKVATCIENWELGIGY